MDLKIPRVNEALEIITNVHSRFHDEIHRIKIEPSEKFFYHINKAYDALNECIPEPDYCPHCGHDMADH